MLHPFCSTRPAQNVDEAAAVSTQEAVFEVSSVQARIWQVGSSAHICAETCHICIAAHTETETPSLSVR